MPNDLPLPRELQHLIEKRECAERRKVSHAAAQDRRAADFGPLGAIESGADLEALPLEDRRSGRDRRRAQRRKRRAAKSNDQ
jgi:hypothetical protein